MALYINLSDLDNEEIFNKIVDYANTPREDREKEEKKIQNEINEIKKEGQCPKGGLNGR